MAFADPPPQQEDFDKQRGFGWKRWLYNFWKDHNALSDTVDGLGGGGCECFRIFYGGVAFNISAKTQNTYHSVGPTGSGADYIWTDLDNLLSETVAITVRYKIDVKDEDPAGKRYQSRLRFRADVLETSTFRQVEVLEYADNTVSGSYQRIEYGDVIFPVSTDHVFEFWHSFNFTPYNVFSWARMEVMLSACHKGDSFEIFGGV